MVAPFSKIITKNRLVIILAAFVLILVIAVIGYYLYKNAVKSISENFSVSVDDLDGTNAKTKIYFTKGLGDAVHKVSEIFGTIPNAEVFEDKLPGVCLDEDTICKGIRDPFKLPVKQDTDISGCGWYFAEDDDKVSFPAYGTKDGPLNPIMQKRAQGGQWYFKNLDEAQIAEDTKRCNRIKSCNIADLYPSRCAWCDTLGKAVPFDPDSKRSKYPDIDDLSCNGRLVQDTDKCKQPNKKTAVINDKGQISNTETVLKDVCTLRDGKLTSNCLAYIAKTAGVKETGKIARIINNDPEKYLEIGTENNRELMIVLNTLKRIDKLQWNFEFFGNGNCKRKDVISYYVNLVDLVTFGKTEESRSAAAWLVYGLPINFDLCSDKMFGPYTLTFVERLFKKSGGQASGTAYPKEQDMYLYTGKKCSEIAMAFQKLCKEDTVSPDFQTRVKASQKCLGVQINSPTDPNSPNNPNNPSNINNTSGINITTPAPNIPGCAEEAPPAAIVPNPYRFADPTNLTGQNEVFHVSGYTNHYWNADSKCSQYNGAKQATKKQLTESWNAGADWCSSGWVSDFHNPLYPSNVQLGKGCGNGKAQITEFMPPTNLAGVNCYGIKPVNGKYPEIKEFTPGVWYQRDYVKPTPVAPPVQGPILYANCDMTGLSKTLPGVGKYRSDQGHYAADVSYIVVPAGFRATIYTGIFSGQSKVIGENQSYNFCTEGSWANDKIQSILVDTPGSPAPAPLPPPPPIAPQPEITGGPVFVLGESGGREGESPWKTLDDKDRKMRNFSMCGNIALKTDWTCGIMWIWGSPGINGDPTKQAPNVPYKFSKTFKNPYNYPLLVYMHLIADASALLYINNKYVTKTHNDGLGMLPWNSAYRFIPPGTSTVDIYAINDSGQPKLSGLNFVMIEYPIDAKVVKPLDYTIGFGAIYSDGTNDIKKYDLNNKPPPNTTYNDLEWGARVVQTDSSWTFVKTPIFGLGNEKPVNHGDDISVSYGPRTVAPVGPQRVNVRRDYIMENNVKKYMDLFL